MATNKDPWLRYLALDKCLSNFSRKFYIEDLRKAVCDFMSREKSAEVTVSKRQIYDDLFQMRTSPELKAPLRPIQMASENTTATPTPASQSSI